MLFTPTPPVISQNARLLDAQRISDGLFVMLKEVPSSSSEALIACYLSSDSLRNDPRNHAVPVLDVFPDPLDDKKTLLVFPLLGHVEKPPFISIPEVIGFIEQTLEVRFVRNASNHSP